MGRRARRSGIANAALRAARAARKDRDEQAHAIAQRVYTFAVEHKGDPDEPLPLHIWAPVQVAAELAAPGAAKLAGLPAEEEVVLDVAAYLLGGFREMVIQLDPEHFRQWRAKQDELEEAPATDDPPQPAETG